MRGRRRPLWSCLGVTTNGGWVTEEGGGGEVWCGWWCGVQLWNSGLVRLMYGERSEQAGIGLRLGVFRAREIKMRDWR